MPQAYRLVKALIIAPSLLSFRRAFFWVSDVRWPKCLTVRLSITSALLVRAAVHPLYFVCTFWQWYMLLFLGAQLSSRPYFSAAHYRHGNIRFDVPWLAARKLCCQSGLHPGLPLTELMVVSRSRSLLLWVKRTHQCRNHPIRKTNKLHQQNLTWRQQLLVTHSFSRQIDCYWKVIR